MLYMRRDVGIHAGQRTTGVVQVHVCVGIHAGQRTIGVVQAQVCGIYMQVRRHYVLLLGFISPVFLKQGL